MLKGVIRSREDTSSKGSEGSAINALDGLPQLSESDVVTTLTTSPNPVQVNSKNICCINPHCKSIIIKAGIAKAVYHENSEASVNDSNPETKEIATTLVCVSTYKFQQYHCTILELMLLFR
jgi:hypothetical protein